MFETTRCPKCNTTLPVLRPTDADYLHALKRDGKQWCLPCLLSYQRQTESYQSETDLDWLFR